MRTGTVTAPSDDKRWRIVQATMRRYGFSPDGLIETLHSAQETFGYLDEPAMRFIAQSLHVPLSRVYGVVTFYNIFSLKPQGEHSCIVCLGTACYIKGSPQIIAAVEAAAGVGRGETTPDKKVSLMTVRCLGACGLAPAVIMDGEVQGNILPDEAVAQVKEWLDE
jgi:bidirectional [NiFe] hydrogenase diaphorase subunit